MLCDAEVTSAFLSFARQRWPGPALQCVGISRARREGFFFPKPLFFALAVRRSCGSEGGAAFLPCSPLPPPRPDAAFFVPFLLCETSVLQEAPPSQQLAPGCLAPSSAVRSICIWELEVWAEFSKSRQHTEMSPGLLRLRPGFCAQPASVPHGPSHSDCSASSSSTTIKVRMNRTMVFSGGLDV